MNKRILDGAALWKSDKLARIQPEWMRPEYANWIPLALANGVFEADTRRIWATVYSYNRPEITFEDAEEIVGRLEPYCAGFLCTYVDKEGMMQGTDLDWFRRLRSATDREITAAGGITTVEDIRALAGMDIHAAVGMAIYTGRLDLKELSAAP